MFGEVSDVDHTEEFRAISAQSKMMCFLDKKCLTTAFVSPGGEYAMLASGKRVDGIVLFAVISDVSDGSTSSTASTGPIITPGSVQIQTFDSLDSCEAEHNPPEIFIWTNGEGKVMRASRPHFEGAKAHLVMKMLENDAETFHYVRFNFDLVPKW